MVLKGERGRVRELWDRGERTDVVVGGGFLAEREVVRAGAAVVVVVVLARLVFFCTGRESLSWGSVVASVAIWISLLPRFLPRGEGTAICWA
jgi:hypothetical protein